MYFKKVIGKDIYLSPVSIDDVEIYTKWMNDYSVTRGTHATHRMYNLLNEKSWIEKTLDKGDYIFAIVSNEDKLLGNVGLMNISFIDGTCEVGIFIGDEDNRSKGYGAKALKLAISYAFNVLNMRNIELSVYDFNERAIACYKKVGFKEYGRRHKCYYIEGKYHDKILMELFKEDFKEND